MVMVSNDDFIVMLWLWLWWLERECAPLLETHCASTTRSRQRRGRTTSRGGSTRTRALISLLSRCHHGLLIFNNPPPHKLHRHHAHTHQQHQITAGPQPQSANELNEDDRHTHTSNGGFRNPRTNCFDDDASATVVHTRF